MTLDMTKLETSLWLSTVFMVSTLAIDTETTLRIHFLLSRITGHLHWMIKNSRVYGLNICWILQRWCLP